MINKNTISPNLKTLLAGHRRFKEKYYENSTLYEKLVSEGQSPKVLVITCSDSRVDPAIILDAEPGELFVVRNVANLVPPCDIDPKHHSTSAAIEFAVLSLQVTDIVIMGHSLCGGIQALMSSDELKPTDGFITPWMDIASSAKSKVMSEYANASKEEKAHQCEKASILNSIKNLKTFPWVEEKVKINKIFLHAWHFDMASGEIEIL